MKRAGFRAVAINNRSTVAVRKLIIIGIASIRQLASAYGNVHEQLQHTTRAQHLEGVGGGKVEERKRRRISRR